MITGRPANPPSPEPPAGSEDRTSSASTRRERPFAGRPLLAFVIALAACTSPQWRRREPALRTAAAATDVALLAVDIAQSRWMVDNYKWHYYEQNPLLGARPSSTAVTAYCAAWAVAVIAGRIWLPPKASWLLSGVVFALEAETVGSNAMIGEGMEW